MKKTISILSLAILFSCNSRKNETANNPATDAAKSTASDMTNGATEAAVPAGTTAHKYGLKSGIITYDVKMEMAGTVIKTKQVLYFDDYGAKECEETYSIEGGKETLTHKSFVKDGYQYVCSIENNGGVKTKARGEGVQAKFSLEEAATQDQFKTIGGETIAGRRCEGFSMVTPSGNIKMYGWKHITLKTDLNDPSTKMKSTSVATTVEENATIPAGKFEVPAGMKMTDM